MVALTGRLARIRNGLTPSEWARMGGLVGVIIALHVAGVADAGGGS